MELQANSVVFDSSVCLKVAWLMGIERRTCCQIECTPLETISSYLSVLLFFRGSFLTAKRSLWAGNPSLFDSRAHLGSSISKKRWHQRVPPLLFFFNLSVYGFVKVAGVVFRAILGIWVANSFVCLFVGSFLASQPLPLLILIFFERQTN